MLDIVDLLLFSLLKDLAVLLVHLHVEVVLFLDGVFTLLLGVDLSVQLLFDQFLAFFLSKLGLFLFFIV